MVSSTIELYYSDLISTVYLKFYLSPFPIQKSSTILALVTALCNDELTANGMRHTDRITNWKLIKVKNQNEICSLIQNNKSYA